MKEHEIRPEAEGLIEGRNAVAETLRSGAPIDKLYIAKGETDRDRKSTRLNSSHMA